MIATESAASVSNASLADTFQGHVAAGNLFIPLDRRSGTVLPLSARPAPHDVHWIRASGRASLHSFTVYSRTYQPQHPAPYNVAWVELEEGLRLVSKVVVRNLAELEIGMALVAGFDDDGLVVFHPTASSGPYTEDRSIQPKGQK